MIQTAAAFPQNGDIVVTREARSPVYYNVGQFPVAVQFSLSSRDEALHLARGFAEKHGVDVWYSENGTGRLLEGYRPRVASRIPVAS
jgi:hypothetical protein